MITYTDYISVEDYNALRAAVGWRQINASQAERGLAGCAHLIAAKDGEYTVGMARVISDGGFFRYLADVIVMPDYQGRGIGKEMVGRLVARVKSDMADEDYVDFILMSAKGKESFYEKFGFGVRPTEQFGHGMGQHIVKDSTES